MVTRSRWGRTAGFGVATVVGWAALSGAAGRPWAAAGGALCTGLAPWFALRPLHRLVHRRSLGPWLLGVHTVLVVLAARWIGVAADPGWGRVALVAAAGLTVAVTTGRGHDE